MPKIEVNEAAFFGLVGERHDAEVLEKRLVAAKAELDEWDMSPADAASRSLKIELNDTNRPDLWSTAGLARQLRLHRTGVIPGYPFFSSAGSLKSTEHRIVVEESVQEIRPWIVGFVVTGMDVSDALLRDLIQTQEKLAWNYGRRRRTVSIGLYRTSFIQWPIIYRGVDPDSLSFVPLQETRTMTLSQILDEHPKGREYAFILKGKPIHPILTDSEGSVLSYPPIINSAGLGAVQVGDRDLFIEVTGTDMPSVCLTASIMACDLADMGFTIEPVKVEYPYDTPFGKNPVFPYYFQPTISVPVGRIHSLLGRKLEPDAIITALTRMGCRATLSEGVVTVAPAEYRNDFLHPVDIIEDVMIGEGMENFPPERPRDFTIGRLTAIEQFTRKAKRLLVGLGFQEMIYNYLGSGKDFADRMCIDPADLVRISNPMSENHEYLRNSPLPGLLGTESISAKASYPHRIFEAGKVAIKDPAENHGIATLQVLGFLLSQNEASFNEAAGIVATLLFYLDREYRLEPSEDPRFIPGRQAKMIRGDKDVGVFGEIHPAVLEKWGVTMPAVGGEIILDRL